MIPATTPARHAAVEAAAAPTPASASTPACKRSAADPDRVGGRPRGRPGDVWPTVRDAAQAWIDDRCARMGAALAYYTLLSLAPLLLIVVSLAGLVVGDEAARGQVALQLRGLLGDSGAQAVQGLLAGARWPAGSLLATAVGLLLMLVGATTVFAELQDTLDHIWRAPQRPQAGPWALLRTRVLSFGLVLGVGFLLIVSLLVDAVLAAGQQRWAGAEGATSLAIELLGAGAGFALTATLFAMIFKWMPRARIAWGDVWAGALLTALLFTLGRQAIGLYLGRGAVGSGYGAAGSLVVVLVWVYYSAQIFLFGAELTWVIAHRFGSRRHRPIPAAGPARPKRQPAPASPSPAAT